ncbi:MFS transporter [Azotobacter bryophylli]|uniref:MFS transporter n=1 Tax=Azotobacter bryophylli TaxID=1986537 RepID=A0ABV7AS02_9GAMM
MDALLILGGLLLMLGGWVWLAIRAFTTSLLWGVGALLPPLTLVFMFGHWRKVSKPVMLMALGLIPLIVGFTLLASHDSERLDAILSLRWLKPEVKQPPELNIDLRGELNGQPFHPQQGELIKRVLTLRDGGDFFSQGEIRIRIPAEHSGLLSLDVLPQDRGGIPIIEISWRSSGQELPKIYLVTRGYTLHLNLLPKSPNLLVGDFHLVLPSQYRTRLSGNIELLTDHLRYRNGKVDASFDSEETLVYVIESYLQRREATHAVQVLDLKGASFPAQELNIQVVARIDGKLEEIGIPLAKEGAIGWQVRGEHYPPLGHSVSLSGLVREGQLRSDLEPNGGVGDRRLAFTLKRLQASPADYRQLRMRIVTSKGSIAEGRFQIFDDKGYIVLRRELEGAGDASFALAPDMIRAIQLIDP